MKRFVHLVDSRSFSLGGFALRMGLFCLLVALGPSTKSVTIIGNGPEKYLIDQLAQQFEEGHPGRYIDVIWDPNLKPVRAVKGKKAQIAVTGTADPGLYSTEIAHDGIAILVNFSNPIEGVTLEELAAIFTGRIRLWSEIQEKASERPITLIDRAFNQNIRDAFTRQLDIVDAIPVQTRVVNSDAEVIEAVSGNLFAISYLAMRPALRAKRDGMPIRVLFVNDVEPEVETVLDGRYPLQRPIFILTRPNRNSLLQEFVQFVLSKKERKVILHAGYFPIFQQG